MYIEYCYGPKWPYLIYIACIGLFGIGICRFVQVLYLGRAPRTKETLPDFREKCRVTRHSRVFRGLTGSQRTLGFWGVTTLRDELVGELSETIMVLIRSDLLAHLSTQFSGISSCEIPFATMPVFTKIHVMHSHLTSRLPSAYENALCHFQNHLYNMSICIFSINYNYTYGIQ